MKQPMQLERAGQGQWSAVPAVYTTAEINQATVDTVNIGEVTKPLWRRKGVLFAGALLGALAGLVVSSIVSPTYRARASVQVVGFDDEHFLREITPSSTILPNASAENYLQNQVKLLESETLARRVVQKLGPQQVASASGPLGRTIASIRHWIPVLRPGAISAEQRRILQFQNALTVRTSLQSQVIEILYDARSPEAAANGANTAAAEFIELNRAARLELVQDTTDWLNRQAADLKKKLDQANGGLQSYARSSGLVFAGQQSTLEEDRMRQIQDSLERARAERAAKEARYKAATESESASATDAGAPLRQYEVDLQSMRRELAQLKTLYTPTNYKVQKLEAQISETEKAIEKAHSDILANLRTEYAAANGLEKILSDAHSRQLSTVERQMDKERRYTTMKAEADTLQKLYDSTLEKVKDAGAASSLRSTAVRMIDEASIPSNPYSPKVPLNMSIGLSAGLIGGIWFVLIREGSNKVKRPGEAAVMQIPELGVIPAAQDAHRLDLIGRGLRKFKYKVNEARLVTRDQHTSVLKESFRGVLTSILFSSSMQKNGETRPGGRVVVVTSVDVKEGKTTILTNLGISAAERKLRVLLIDADLRRPRLHELLDVPNDWGVSNLLTERNASFYESTPLVGLVRETRTPNLWVLPAGPAVDTIHSLLYSADIESLLDRYRKEFDLVLIDTPPMMLYSDGRVLGRMSDGVVMVIRANTKSRDELKATYLRFMLDQIPILGTILNDWRMEPNEIRAYGRYHQHYQQGR